jgi:hypothetical protein
MAEQPWNFTNALCSEIGTEMFFVEDRDEQDLTSLSDYKVAISICRKCEHISDCAEWGIKHEGFGIWGGLTPKQRKTIRQSRNIIIITTELNTLG